MPTGARDARTTHVNLFTTDDFLDTLGASFFPGRRRAIELRVIEGRVLRLLVIDGKQVIHSAPFYDFPQPLDVAPAGLIEPLRYFPRTVICTNQLEPRLEPMPGTWPSPYLRWQRFADFEAFEHHVDHHGARLADSRRQRRRLEQALGPLSFQFNDARAAVFDAAVKWKGAQYAASGFTNLFARPACVQLFRELHRRGVVVVNSLSAGSTLLAVHLGAVTDGRFAWWVPTYDPALSKYSPGRLLLEDTLRESHARGHLEFDFLLGDEAYKYHYATDVRVVGALGTPPLLERMAVDARAAVVRTLAARPALDRLVRRAYRSLKAQRAVA
jgi:hypothetical protein